MKNTSAVSQSRLLVKSRRLCVYLAMAAPLAAMAQQTVFNDTFVNGSTVGLTSIPGGTLTDSSTSYDFGAAKSISTLASVGTAVTPGTLAVGMVGTSAAYIEGDAVVLANPVTLAIPGDSIDIQQVFTATTNMWTVSGYGASAYFSLGLFYSGGSAPYTNLFNNGLESNLSADTAGGAQNWLGYRANITYGGGTANATSTIYNRPAQNQGNNLNQSVIGYVSGGVNLGQSAQNIPTLIIGNQYTIDFNITLTTNGSLSMTNTLYTGVGTGGTILGTNVATASGAKIVTTNFDAICIGGYRTGTSANGVTTNWINQIIITFTSSNQAGPYFTLTNLSGGSGCGSADIGLNGSVVTNSYLLYTNGVYTGQAKAGTGSALDFGVQSLAGIYTIYASNTVTASVGPMFGHLTISVSAPTISVQPVNASTVTNYMASFGVVATGNTLAYQWYKNGVPLTNGGDFAGVTTASLTISPAQAGDAATTATGYYVVVRDPCGDSVTSSPNASLTLLAANNLVWQGGNPDNNWDLATTLNFTNSQGAFEAFSNADYVTFNDASPNTSIILSNNLVSSLVTVSGTQGYSFAGPGSVVGFGGLVDEDSSPVTITSTNFYTGGTFISNNATLNLGNNSSGSDGFVAGVVTVDTNGVLNYDYFSNQTIANSLAGSGTVNYESYNGGTLTLPLAGVSSNFNGVANLVTGVRVHAQTGGSYAFGNGSTVNVPSYSQAYCDTETYNNIFNIAGTGWTGATPQTGAISVFGSIFTGSINLTANARISGTISGGTVLCVISGPYQLEVWGNVGSYVLNVGPTNGISTYGSTLITSGTVRALNTNGISTGPLTMDVAGDFRLNGNNLTVSNLSSVNSGQVTGNGATIQNTATTNCSLTVGADSTSTEFDGIFTNGGSGTLGLTKIGTGTLTLTGINSNSGPVIVNAGTLLMTGAGSFSSASEIIAASGAVYDVTGTGNPLTLNAGQLLGGNGTVNGAVVAAAGSTVAPGLPLGTLALSGSATVNGVYRVNLDRTNTPSNCSQLSSSGGTITFSSATLSVTNVGPALQVGDTFQLFAGGTAGFSAYQLETSDPANNVTYIWNNGIATSGTLSVASVTYNTIIPTLPPKVIGLRLSGSNVSITATNGVTGGTYYLLSTTNLALPSAQWTCVSTNVVTTSGSSASFNFTGTNIFSAASPQKFFMLSSTNN